jgi:hypothetical protein
MVRKAKHCRWCAGINSRLSFSTHDTWSIVHSRPKDPSDIGEGGEGGRGRLREEERGREGAVRVKVGEGGGERRRGRREGEEI